MSEEGKDYLKAKMLWSNKSLHLSHKRPNISPHPLHRPPPYTHTHTQIKAMHHFVAQHWIAVLLCNRAPCRQCDSCLLTFAAPCAFCKSPDNSFLCQKYKCKMRYLKKTPPVATSSFTTAATGWLYRISGSISPFDCVLFVIPRHDLARLRST